MEMSRRTLLKAGLLSVAVAAGIRAVSRPRVLLHVNTDHPLCHQLEIWLNDEKQDNVTVADEGEGYIIRYCPRTQDYQFLTQERVEGKVVVHCPGISRAKLEATTQAWAEARRQTGDRTALQFVRERAWGHSA